MDLRVLEYFQFVARYRNFSRAATHFSIGQPALSRQIAGLEKELGVRLFDRDTRNVKLTAAGRVLYDDAELLIRHHEVIAGRMEAAQRGFEGQLDIAVVATHGALVTPLLTAYIKAFPRVRLRIDAVGFDQLSDCIVNGVYDLAFTLDFAVPNDDQVIRTPVEQDRFVAVMTQDFPADIGNVASVTGLLDWPLILPRFADPPFLRHLRAIARGHGGVNIEYVADTDTVMLAVSLGLGITLLPRRIAAAGYGHQSFRFCELADIDTSFSTILIHRANDTRPILQNFLDVVRQERDSLSPHMESVKAGTHGRALTD